MRSPYKVLIVDDSSLMRQLLTQIIGSDPELEVDRYGRAILSWPARKSSLSTPMYSLWISRCRGWMV